MSDESNLTHLSFSSLEKAIAELTRMQKENLILQFELAESKQKLNDLKLLAQIEKNVYSGIKRFFKEERS